VAGVRAGATEAASGERPIRAAEVVGALRTTERSVDPTTVTLLRLLAELAERDPTHA